MNLPDVREFRKCATDVSQKSHFKVTVFCHTLHNLQIHRFRAGWVYRATGANRGEQVTGALAGLCCYHLPITSFQLAGRVRGDWRRGGGRMRFDPMINDVDLCTQP